MTLAVFWFSTTMAGFLRIRAGDWTAHRRWMIRSYAISLAVITVRFMDTPAGLTQEEWYPIMTWLCWVPNALIGYAYTKITDDRGNLLLPSRAAGMSNLAGSRNVR